jgi:ferrous iron transport protein A
MSTPLGARARVFGGLLVSRLSDFAVGQSGRVVSVSGDGEISCRLLEMGLTPGVEIKLLGTAPFGDPLEIELRGYRLSLRKSEARLVEVAPR